MNIPKVCLISFPRTVCICIQWTAVAVLLFSGFFAPSVMAQATLTGTVTNSATGRTLEGARVVIKNTEREVITDSQGVY
ncbi:MAG: hypothetical protein HY736_18525, partial [Verrucomicrobia bacterium]|nr:hypothetical protein [Verrucomicrobiota bacterium]